MIPRSWCISNSLAMVTHWFCISHGHIDALRSRLNWQFERSDMSRGWAWRRLSPKKCARPRRSRSYSVSNPGRKGELEPEACCGGWRRARLTSLQGRSCKRAAQQSDCLDLGIARLRSEVCLDNEVEVWKSTSVDGGRGECFCWVVFNDRSRD